jgi:TonB-linked SusC/RagA family outer membrane protein
VTKFLSAGMNVYGTEERVPQGIPNTLNAYMRGSPYSSLYYDDGTYKHEPHDDAMVSNPYLYEYEDNYHRKREVAATLFGKITLPLGFSFKVSWANRFYGIKDYRFTPSKATLGEGGATGSRRDITHHDWLVDNIFNWNRLLGGIHDFDVTLLYNVEKASYWSSYQSNADFEPNESLTFHNLAIGASPVISNNDTQSTGDAFMARLNYGLLDRYLLTASFRRDGYSAFGQKQPWANFPAFALGWRLTEEDFFNVGWLNYLKLRFSWGENGNREIGQYAALSRMNTTKYIYGNSSVTGIYTTNLANEELKWERTRAINIGLDFATLGGRLSGSVEVYDMSTTDLLLERSLPNITGFESVFANLGEVENRGLEVSLNSAIFTANNFTWNSNLNFWTNKNTIKHLYGDMVDVYDEAGNVIGQREEDDIQNGWYIGHAIDEIFDYKIIGVWQLGEEEEADAYGRAPGDLKLEDVNGDGNLDYDDQQFQGYKKPRYRFSWRNDFTLFRNIDVSFLLIANLGYYGANNRHFSSVCCQERLNNIIHPYWTPNNPTTEWGRLFSVNSSPATNWWESKSFLRLQYFTIGYNVPKPFLNRISIRSLRIYGNIQNLPAISGWQYNWDVETSQPTPVIYTFGIDLSI